MAVTARLRLKDLNREALLAAVRKAGGVYTTGVAVPPVVMVVLVVVLVPLLPHRLIHNHEGAYLAAIKSDLRNLVTAQEDYFADSSEYFAGRLMEDSTAALGNGWAMRFTPSTGVTISIGVATATGWNATARHAAIVTVCGTFIGTAAPPIAGAQEGEPKCVDP